MILGPGCPVWFIDAQPISDAACDGSNHRESGFAKSANPLWNNDHPNYLVVKFFEAVHIKELEWRLKLQSAAEDNEKLRDIRDQVSTKIDSALQFSAVCFVVYLLLLMPPAVHSLFEQPACNWRTKPF
jgi:hypothetical protein